MINIRGNDRQFRSLVPSSVVVRYLDSALRFTCIVGILLQRKNGVNETCWWHFLLSFVPGNSDIFKEWYRYGPLLCVLLCSSSQFLWVISCLVKINSQTRYVVSSKVDLLATYGGVNIQWHSKYRYGRQIHLKYTYGLGSNIDTSGIRIIVWSIVWSG